MNTTLWCAWGALSGVLLMAACAGNIQIPAPGPNDPANPAAGGYHDTAPESVLASGPSAPVPGGIDSRAGQARDHGAMSHDRGNGGAAMRGNSHAEDGEEMRHDH